MIGYVKKTDESGFSAIHCPICGWSEMLDNSISGNWECENCSEQFFITDMRLVTLVSTEQPSSPFASQPWRAIETVNDCTEHDIIGFSNGILLCVRCGEVSRIADPLPLEHFPIVANDEPTED